MAVYEEDDTQTLTHMSSWRAGGEADLSSLRPRVCDTALHPQVHVYTPYLCFTVSLSPAPIDCRRSPREKKDTFRVW